MTSLDQPTTGEQVVTLDPVALLKELRQQVTLLEADLRDRAAEEPKASQLRAEYQAARDAERIAATYSAWLDDRITQAAVAWVLSTVFVRYCEDNRLIPYPFLSGPGEARAESEAREDAYLAGSLKNRRDWLYEAFQYLADAHPTVASLFDKKHNPLWDIEIGYETAKALLDFWRRLGPDGAIAHDFTGAETRFLGDLYQDLSEHARKTYALLQTPEFVEEFILDLTLEPAIQEFGLGGHDGKGLRTIDPTCGSGHFLLGLFRRILAEWEQQEPGTDRWELIRRSLGSVHGVDKNPFAVSIARFRLLLAVLEAGRVETLSEATLFPINVAVGDSLIHGRGALHRKKDEAVLFDLGDGGEVHEHTYTTEDIDEYVSSVDLLGYESYHVVVGNPPYITVKDKGENESYRERYSACSGKYALSAPFARRFFGLARRTAGEQAGFAGQITANSFMKREFGKKLIEKFFFERVHLTHVIDTSGAYIPGHGTPTVILVGRNHRPFASAPIRAVLGVRGEPEQPADAAQGQVWRAIVGQVSRAGSESDWISVEDAPRGSFDSHPWSVSGGGAGDLLTKLEQNCKKTLGNGTESIGFAAITGDDDVFCSTRPFPTSWSRAGIPVKDFIEGDRVRDFRIDDPLVAVFPYLPGGDLSAAVVNAVLWNYRERLRSGLAFGQTREQKGMNWWEYILPNPRRLNSLDLISFAFVATHNHFVLDRGGKVFNRSAPVIKLPEGATEDDHLALLGVLNSSTACFWLKQVSQSKGGSGLGRGVQDEAWEDRFEFTGTKLEQFPLPKDLPLALGGALDGLAQAAAAQEPSAVAAGSTPTRDALDAARGSWSDLRGRMIALQEELDWQVYGSYGLLSESEVSATTMPDPEQAPRIALGERSFEIVLARKVAAGEAETAWFERHRSTPITEIPGHWPEDYRDVVQARIDLIEKRRDLALIERPECKRRWASEPWEKREKAAIRTWLLDRAEKRELWFGLRDEIEQPLTMTINRLADVLSRDSDVRDVAALYANDHLGKRDLPLVEVLESVLADEHVPYLAAMRYKPTGLRKRADWEQVWKLQREEDRTGERLDIAVPPKYGPTDFVKTSYWSQRGKLDVPKERFISYPGASPDGDDTLLLGWAGWDHKDQAQALVNLLLDRGDESGWPVEKLTALVAGMTEVMPWVKQWHSEHDADWGGVPAEEFGVFLAERYTRYGLRDSDLAAWRPPAATRGRRKAVG